MKGVILAGGTGSRLGKLTSVLNKHLVAVGKVPMIEYPLATLRKMGVNDICVVSGSEHIGTIVSYLTKEHPDMDFTYRVQKKAGGIAQALLLAEDFAGDSPIVVILGDNIFGDDNFKEVYEHWGYSTSWCGAKIFLKKVDDPCRFGVAQIKNDKIISIVEKPKKPKSNLAVTGLYIYDWGVFSRIKKLKPSDRGELEITDVNESYLNNGCLSYHVVQGFWSDAGTHESRRKVEEYLHKKGE